MLATIKGLHAVFTNYPSKKESIMPYTYGKTKEEREQTDRAHNFFMEVESNSAAYHDYSLVVGKSKEYAEKVLNTPLA
jgi:hypothetical protein